MPAYFIAEITVTDPNAYRENVARVPETVARYGGRYLVRGGAATTVMGDRQPGRVIVIEFDSVERAQAWLGSPEYRAVAPLRECSAVSHAVIVEGCDAPATIGVSWVTEAPRP